MTELSVEALRHDCVPGVLAIAFFTLRPSCEQGWLAVWQELAEMARTMPACRCFRLLTDLGDGIHCAAMSEWDDRKALATFWRESGATWVEDALGYSCTPTTFLIFTAVTLHEQNRTHGMHIR